MAFWLILTFAISAETPVDSAQQAEKQRFFESSIRPILVEHCQKCHGPQKQWGGLRLDTKAGLMKGGESGPVVVPARSIESRLILAVQQSDPDFKMPPEGKLSPRQIADLAKWIDQGADFPNEKPSSGKRHRDPNHWAFQPPQRPPIPKVKERLWVESPIDFFILSKLEPTGISPAPKADRRTLIRRVTYDLTGLPPTPEEVAGFLADERPDAYAQLIDRLLASPTYGERWGRHWLDVARYADSNGLDENIAHGNAWRYRDYVVDSFNADTRFDHFVQEQLAGDLLPAEDDPTRRKNLIATGFLAIGPKVLAEVDETKMQMDLIDEQIETMGRVFWGMTLGCARCHDHKFDAIESADYYGFAGIFKSTRTMEHFRKIAKWHENVLPSPQSRKLETDHADRLAALKIAVENQSVVVKSYSAESASAALNTEFLPADAGLIVESLRHKRLQDEFAKWQKNPPELPSAMGVAEDKVTDVPIHVRGSHLKLGEVVSRHLPVVIRGPASRGFSPAQSGRKELADWCTDPAHPLTSRVIVNRIWRWHFGKGIVKSVDNFGSLGDAPSHPELLDWLAVRFVEDGWSIKSLHRLILTSSTYQQQSAATPATVARDPENRLFSRAEVRRLEAEELRDSLLQISGQLDSSMGGALLKVKNRAFLFDHTSKDLTEYTSCRRSMYLPVIRNNVYDVFQLFDFPDPAISSGDRASTTVAPQSLMLMNSELALSSAAQFADRLITECSAEETRVQKLSWLAYGRPATERELQANRDFLAMLIARNANPEESTERKHRQAWTWLCQTVLASNELLYLR